MQLQALVSVCLMAAVVVVTDVQASATADLSTLKDTKTALQNAQAAVEDLQLLLYNNTLSTTKLTSAGTTDTEPAGHDTTTEPGTTTSPDTTTIEPHTTTPDSTTLSDTTTESPETKTSDRTTAEPDTTTTSSDTTSRSDTTTAESDPTTISNTTSTEPDTTTSVTTTAETDSTMTSDTITTSDTISAEPDTTTSVTTTTEPDSTMASDTTTAEPDTTTTSDTSSSESDSTRTSPATTEEPDTKTTYETTTAEPDSTTESETTTVQPDSTTTSGTTTAEPDSTTPSDTTTAESDSTTPSGSTTAELDSTTASDSTTTEPEITITTSGTTPTAEPVSSSSSIPSESTGSTKLTSTSAESSTTPTAEPSSSSSSISSESTGSTKLTSTSAESSTTPTAEPVSSSSSIPSESTSSTKLTSTSAESSTTPTAEPVSSSSSIPSESTGSTKLTSTSAESSTTSTEFSNPPGTTITITTPNTNSQETISITPTPTGPENSILGNFGALFLPIAITPSPGTTTLHPYSDGVLETSVSVSSLQRLSANSQNESLHGMFSAADELTRNASSSSSVQTKLSEHNERNERSGQNKGIRHLLWFDELLPVETSGKTNSQKSVIRITKVNSGAKKAGGGSRSNQKLTHDRETLAKPSANEENRGLISLGMDFSKSKRDTAQFHSHDTDSSRSSRKNSIKKATSDNDEEFYVPYIMSQVEDADDDKTFENQSFIPSVPNSISEIAKEIILLRGSEQNADMLTSKREEDQHLSLRDKVYSQLENNQEERFNHPFDYTNRIKRAIRVDMDNDGSSNHTSWQKDVEQTLGAIQQLTVEITNGAIDDSVAKELDTAASTLDDLVMEASADPSLVLDPDALTELASNVTGAMEEALVVVEREIDNAQHDVNVLIAVVVVLSVLFVALLMGLLLAFTRPWSKRCTLPGQRRIKKKRSPDLIDDSSPDQEITISTKSYVSHSGTDFVNTYQGSISNSITFAGSHANLNHKDDEEASRNKSKKASKNGSSIAMTSIRYTGDFMDDEVNYGKTGAVVDLNPWQNVKIANTNHGVNYTQNGSGLRSSVHKSHDESFREDFNGVESKVNGARKSSLSSDVETNGNVFKTDSDNAFIRNDRHRGSANSIHEHLDLQLHIIEDEGNDC